MSNRNKKNMGGLIWITGYSGAGKTTISQKVYNKLSEHNIPTVLLDGDDIRSILGERFGHDLDDRRQLASVYGRLCKKITDCGVTVVIATVAMFEAVRIENRISNSRYLEVYLKVPLELRAERDPKGLYKAATMKGSSLSDGLKGLEEPVNPDLVIHNYGINTPESVASLIASKYIGLIEEEDLTDLAIDLNVKQEITRAEYWDSYYAKRNAPIAPSSFALFCKENYLNDHNHILEFGCGNGRDSFYFAKTQRVTAIDESSVVVEFNRGRTLQEGLLNIDFIQGEFGSEIVGLPGEVDAIYSRFVMHAMPEDAETRALNTSWKMLKNQGWLFLEFRTILDPLMEKGERISETERKTDHYRRFIDFSVFCRKVKELGFELVYSIERQGLARHGDDDPVVGRVIAKKMLRV